MNLIIFNMLSFHCEQTRSISSYTWGICLCSFFCKPLKMYPLWREDLCSQNGGMSDLHRSVPSLCWLVYHTAGICTSVILHLPWPPGQPPQGSFCSLSSFTASLKCLECPSLMGVRKCGWGGSCVPREGIASDLPALNEKNLPASSTGWL